jgi:hypothetical protein
MSITVKKIFLLLLACTSLLSCKSQVRTDSVWTTAYEQKKYDEINDAIKPRLPNEEKREKFVSYIIMRLKTELPKGLESVSADSLKKLSVKIGEEYGFAHADGHGGGLIPKAIAWTPDLEKTFREAILKGTKTADLDKSNKLCDCFITELKKIYPDSVMMPVPHNIALKIVNQCQDVILGKGKN